MIIDTSAINNIVYFTQISADFVVIDGSSTIQVDVIGMCVCST